MITAVIFPPTDIIRVTLNGNLPHFTSAIAKIPHLNNIKSKKLWIFNESYYIIKFDAKAFKRDKINEFLEISNHISTPIGTQIYNIVVKNNSEFKDLIGTEASANL